MDAPADDGRSAGISARFADIRQHVWHEASGRPAMRQGRRNSDRRRRPAYGRQTAKPCGPRDTPKSGRSP
jgi:hypothetical protein